MTNLSAEPMPPDHSAELKRRAWLVIALFVATVVYGVVLLAAFEPEVQDLAATELFARSDDARAFLIADLVFPLLYGVGSSIAQWRLGRRLTGARPPRLFIAAILALSTAAVFDLTENILLLAALASDSSGPVSVAHAIAVPKVIAFVAGAVLTLPVVARAAITLNRL